MNSLQKVFLVFSVLVFITLFFLLPMQASSAPAGHQVQGVQPDEINVAALMPGLQLHYYLDFTKENLLEMPRSETWPGERGEPVAQLNSSFGREPIFQPAVTVMWGSVLPVIFIVMLKEAIFFRLCPMMVSWSISIINLCLRTLNSMLIVSLLFLLFYLIRRGIIRLLLSIFNEEEPGH